MGFVNRVNFVPAGSNVSFPSLTLCWRVGYKRSAMKSLGYVKYNQATDFGQFPANMTMVRFANGI